MLNECNTFLKKHFESNRPSSSFRVLEAGGGSISHFYLPKNSTLISLDIEFGQLEKNESNADCVQGDIHCLPFAQNSFDMLICFNVIEHLDDPKESLDQMYACLKPGGLLVLGCPVRNSLKGLITRLTPIGFHRWYYRVIVKKPDRGDGHYDAFETPFRAIVAERPLKTWCKTRALNLKFFNAYDGAKAYQIVTGSGLRRLFSLPYYALATLGRWLSFGRWRAEQSDILLVAEKR